MKDVLKPYYYVAKCSTEQACTKCNYFVSSIVVNRGPHYTLYCSSCGAYIKHANDNDKRHTYIEKVYVKDNTPVKLLQLYIDSQKTMTTKK